MSVAKTETATVATAQIETAPVATVQLVTAPVATVQLVTTPVATVQLVTTPVATVQLATAPVATGVAHASAARIATVQITAALAVLTCIAACRDPRPATAPGAAPRTTTAATDPHERELAALRALEKQRRGEIDFATLAPSDVALGPDPYRIAALRGGRRLVGLLRGESAVALLDEHGAELGRVAAPRSPGGLAVSAADDIVVVGEAAHELAQYRVQGDRLERVATVPVGALAIRDVALAPDGRTAYVVEEKDGRLLAVSLDERSATDRRLRATGERELGRCHGPVQVEAIEGHVAVNCLLDHTIEIRRDDGAIARIHHDGPLWSMAAVRTPDGGLLIAAGGVENHPLEREDGGFGYIDSYVFLYRLAPGASEPVQLAEVDTSALGAVTPKWLAIRTADTGAISVITAGYASPALVTLTWRSGELAAPPEVTQVELLPGTSDAVLAGDSIVAANPLLDGWVVRHAGALRVVPVAAARPPRDALSRIGELLFFTTMMAPWSSTEGKRSRFTCETCHHEGYIDGRTHFTGRADVHATTRPLLGLFNNQPYFSRALDRTMTQMVNAEFRVANRHNGRDPWFALTRADVPWLAHVPGAPAQLPAELLREAFMRFLADFTHRANPAAIDRMGEAPAGGSVKPSTPRGPASLEPGRFTERERAGAQTFRDRCARCHAARLIAEDPATEVPFERWESLILSPSGPIVWNNAVYEKTGVTPLVHASGARVPTLRRLYKKWPYFTNGSARSLDDVLDRFAASPAAAYHDSVPSDGPLTRLTVDEKSALRAFLDLL